MKVIGKVEIEGVSVRTAFFKRLLASNKSGALKGFSTRAVVSRMTISA